MYSKGDYTNVNTAMLFDNNCWLSSITFSVIIGVPGAQASRTSVEENH